MRIGNLEDLCQTMEEMHQANTEARGTGSTEWRTDGAAGQVKCALLVIESGIPSDRPKLLDGEGCLCSKSLPGPVSLMRVVSADRGAKGETENNPVRHSDGQVTMRHQHSSDSVTWLDRKEMQGWERVKLGNGNPRHLQSCWTT